MRSAKRDERLFFCKKKKICFLTVGCGGVYAKCISSISNYRRGFLASKTFFICSVFGVRCVC